MQSSQQQQMMPQLEAFRPQVEQHAVQRAVSPAAVFGVPLSQVVCRHLVPGDSRVSILLPRSILALAEFLCQHHVREEGMFQVQGQPEQVQALIAAVNAHEAAFSSKRQLERVNSHAEFFAIVSNQVPVELNLGAFPAPVIATVFKTFWQRLPEPLFPVVTLSQLVEVAKHGGDVLRVAKASLPEVNFAVLEGLLDFLAVVAGYSEINKMTPSHLAMCFAPLLFAVPESTVWGDVFLVMTALITSSMRPAVPFHVN